MYIYIYVYYEYVILYYVTYKSIINMVCHPFVSEPHRQTTRHPPSRTGMTACRRPAGDSRSTHHGPLHHLKVEDKASKCGHIPSVSTLEVEKEGRKHRIPHSLKMFEAFLVLAHGFWCMSPQR